MELREMFFEELAISLDYWINESTKTLLNENADLMWTDNTESFKIIRALLQSVEIDETDFKRVFTEFFRGITNHTLTIIDGGTSLSDESRLYLVDRNGESIGEGLHELFFDYLIKTGRL